MARAIPTAVLVGLFALAHSASPASPSSAGMARADAPAQAAGIIALPIDDFEGPDWPAGRPWTIVMDPEDPRTVGYSWAPRTCRASSGAWSLWAVGGGTQGARLACGDPYPPNIRSAIRLELDLREHADASVLRLAFDLWTDTISDSASGDFFSVNYMMPNEEGYLEQVTVMDWTGATGSSFRTVRLDLRDLAEVHDPHRHFDLAGREVEFEFVFRTARDSTFRPTGVFMDHVRLERDGVPTPTIEATAEPSKTEVPSPTPTGERATATSTTSRPTAGPTSSPQATVTVMHSATILLPIAHRRP